MVARLQRVWILCAAPFLGAFAAHPCIDHLFMLLLGMGIAALGMRKQHCCVTDHNFEKVTVKVKEVNYERP